MSPKKRNKNNRKLPTGWRYKHGAYHYRVPAMAQHLWDDKGEFMLGRTLAEAHAVFAHRIGYEGNVRTMANLCDRYTLEVVPDKAAATRKSNMYSIARIRKVFGNSEVSEIQPKHIYKYKDKTGSEESKKKANLDLEVLSHMFTKSIEWGIRNSHPMTNKKVVKFSLPHRKVKVDKADLVAFAATLPRKWQLYLSLKIWSGRRKGELLRLRRSDLSDEGMRFQNNKNPDDEFILAWEPETTAVVNELLNLYQGISSIYLFHTRTGQPYINDDGVTSGFDSIWQRRMKKCVDDGIVKTRFTEHDLRKIRASMLSREQAQLFLRHVDPKQTDTYRLEPTIVRIDRAKTHD